MNLSAGPVTLLSSDMESGLLKHNVVMAQPAPPEDVSNVWVIVWWRAVGVLGLCLGEGWNSVPGLLGCCAVVAVLARLCRYEAAL